MQKKRARRAPVEAARPPLPPPHPVVGDDARARSRHHGLMQDYEELLKDTAAKRKRLQMERRKKLDLSNEVKFLQRRYKYLIKNSSPTPYKLKSHSHSQTTSSAMKHKAQKFHAAFSTQPQSPEYVRYGQLSQHDSSCRDREVAVPSTSMILDLNQISLPDGEEEEFHVALDPVPMEKSSKRYGSNGCVPGSDPKQSICGDVGSGTNRSGKRKNLLQDQVAMKI
uniref:Putative histone acetyltransferase HAC-like 1 n=1 Tax=Anthurium amnicola TaxID=1678845 RepID=A0A1D1Y0C9_9ARAE